MATKKKTKAKAAPSAPITRAVIYARVSSTQQKTQGHGLESQTVRCREFARMKGYQVVETFCDDASGSLVDRPGMQAMLGFLKGYRREGMIVLIDDISRLARSLEAHLQLRTAIAAVGGVLQSPSIEFGEDSDSQLVENLLASVSQHQRQKNADQTRNRMRARASIGYSVLRAPVGYRYERIAGHGKMLVPDEPAATAVRDALEGYASGRFTCLSEVMRFLATNPSYPADQRMRLTVERIREMTDRLTYAGYIDMPEWGLRLVPAKHEALISYETFQRVQERRRGKAHAPARKDLNQDFPLRGFIACGSCGKPLMGCFSTSRSGQRHPYYLCQRKGCASYGKSIRRDEVEGQFTELLSSLKPTPALLEVAAAMFRDLWNGRMTQASERATTIKIELAKVDRQIGQLLDRVIETDSRTIVKTYESRIATLEGEKALLTERVANCGRPLKSFDDTFRTALNFLANPCELWLSDDLADKRGGPPDLRRQSQLCERDRL